ncbi:S-layer homology domain-containing protein [Bacillus massiliigorillae]|uniref:S-layer homology domain-containing protein n=1 Tax=Bacillus massiliigorillae TaxID=1243664 RepID=UPI0003A99F81|nr:S-layer homology domain-containing protein [Bacillus massiliigorillae]
MKKKFTSIFLSFLLLTCFAVPNGQAATFKDVSTSYTFYEEINYLTSKGIITGYSDGTFKPNETVTRAAAVIMIGRALGLDGAQRPTKFADVSKSSVASGYIQSSVEAGIISGFTDGTFRPNESVTRGQVAIFLVRAFGLEETTDVTFKDVSMNSAAYPYIGKLLAAKITTGYSDNTYRPNIAVTRGQFSAFMARALNPAFLPGTNKMDVSFLNVGQGDSIFIKFPNDKTMLVDAGRSDNAVAKELNALGVKSIDTFVATHPDADHIGGADYVIKNYNVKTVIDSGQEHTTQTYIDYLEAIDAAGSTFKEAVIGQNITLDSDIDVKVLYVDNKASELNDGSIVLMVTYGNIDYLLTGDAGTEVEAKLVAKYNLQAEVLKVSHHGSSTGSSQAFLNEVKPKYAILSYGENNSYGHPNSTVVNRLKAVNATILDTVKGPINTSTNGRTLTVNGGGTVTPTASVKIVSKDLAGEIVGIQNTGTTSVNLSGWKLVSVQGNQTYTFGNITIDAGKTIYITSGPNAKNTPPYYRWSTGNIWANSGDKAELYNENGVKVSEMN